MRLGIVPQEHLLHMPCMLLQAVNYAGLVPVLVQVINEQKNQIEEQKSENALLRNELEQLKIMLEALSKE